MATTAIMAAFLLLLVLLVISNVSCRIEDILEPLEDLKILDSEKSDLVLFATDFSDEHVEACYRIRCYLATIGENLGSVESYYQRLNLRKDLVAFFNDISHWTNLSKNFTTSTTTSVIMSDSPVSRDMFKGAELALDSQVFVVHGKDVTEVYKIFPGDEDDEIRMNKLKKTEEEEEILIWEERRGDLRGRLLRAGFVMSDNHFINSLDDQGNLDGLHGQILDILSGKLNFTFEITAFANFSFGELSENGTKIGGILGHLADGYLDIISDVVSVTEERKKFISFSVPVTEEVYTFGMLLPKAGYTFGQYTKVFRWSFWVVSIMSVASLSGIIHLMVGFGGRQRSFAESLQFVCSCFFMRELDTGFAGGIRTFSGRIIAFTALGLGFVVFSGYSAVLTSHLTVKEAVSGFEKWEDLLSDDVKVAMNLGSMYTDVLSLSKEGSTFRRLFEKIKRDPLGFYRGGRYNGIAHSLGSEKKRLMNLGYLVATSTESLMIMPGYPCKLTHTPLTMRTPIALVFQRDANALVSVFNHQIKRMHESGLIQRLREKYLPSESRVEGYCKSDEDEEDALSIGYTGTIFCFGIVAVGIGLSLVSFATEVISRRMSKKQPM